MEAVCQGCSKVFYYKKGFGKFCSMKCRKSGENHTCLTCDKSFYVNKHQMATGRGKYCSRQCKPKATALVCQTCGKPFRLSQYLVERGRGKYCSRECQPGRQMGKCETCGKEFYCPPSQKRNNWGKFCSRECYRKPQRDRTVEEWFWLYMKDIPRLGVPNCWEWPGPKDQSGYGIINKKNKNGKRYRAARVAYEIFNGPTNDSLMILHHCDNPPCVEPEHLYQGNSAQNVRDMVIRGRFGGSRSVLKPQDIPIIRALLREGVEPKKIAAVFHVNTNHISRIKHGKIWKHIP